jgi:streptomycin 6-kinase
VAVMIIPSQLVANCQKTSERTIWLESLPALLEELTDRWSLRVGPPFDHSGTCSWVAPAVRKDGIPAVLKLAMPHMEGEHEIEGLRFWNGNPTVTLIEADDQSGAMLLERCQPGTSLRSEPEASQDEIIAGMLKQIRRVNEQSKGFHQFPHVSDMLEVWQRETLVQKQNWPDAGLVRESLSIFERLSRSSPTDTVLATDLHAGNVLRAEREPWLMIDPKPFVGDAAFDVVQHLINCEERLHADPIALVNRVAGLAKVDPERARLWTFARAAADPREDWNNVLWVEVARKLAP